MVDQSALTVVRIILLITINHVNIFIFSGTLIMRLTTDNENKFVVDILTDLRNEKFSRLAWMHFLANSWKRSCATARANPVLKRSWTYTTIFMSAFALTVLAANFIFEETGATLRLMPGFLFFVGWQQSDLYWHLGLNHESRTGILLRVIGI